MSKWKKRAIIAVSGLVLLFGAIVIAGVLEPSVDPDLHDKLVQASPAQVEELIAGETKKLDVSALSITVLDGTKLGIPEQGGADQLQNMSFGRASEDGLMQVASLSKAVGAAVILIVADQQGVGLDDDIRGQITSLDIASIEGGDRPVTLRQLLSHTTGASQSGYPGYAIGSEIPTTAEVINDPPRIFEFPLEFGGAPGEFLYSGGGYTIAQLWAEDVLRQPFAEIAEQKLLTPLGLLQSTFIQPLDRKQLEPHKLIGADAGFDPTEGLFSALDNSWHIFPEQAAAGLWATSQDYALFIAALLDAAAGAKNAIPASVAAAMITPQTETGYAPGSYYGLGVMVAADQDGNILNISHSGSNPGYRSYFVARPSTEGTPSRVVVVTANTGNSAYLNKAIGPALLERP